jgi:hypothetical protein
MSLKGNDETNEKFLNEVTFITFWCMDLEVNYLGRFLSSENFGSSMY